MNFLAHLYLAGEDEELILGQMLGDFLEPGWRERVPPGVQRGVRQHQQVDLFTDRHPVFKRSRARLPPGLRRYAGIVIDIYYDHLLATHWPRFHAELTLEEFARSRYEVLQKKERDLTSKLRRVLPSIVRHDWLTSYRGNAGIERALRDVSRRLRRENPVAAAGKALRRQHDGLDEDFLEFFPDLERFVEEQG